MELSQLDENQARNDLEVIACKEGLDFIEMESKDLVIVDQESREAASAVRSQIKDIEKRLKAREDFFKKPAQEYVKKMTAFFKYFSERLENSDRLLKQKQVADFEAQEKARREAQAKLDEENRLRREAAEKEAAEKRRLAEEEAKKNNTVAAPVEVIVEPVEVMVAPTETMVRTEQGGTTFSKRWTFTVEIADQVPREYCEPVDNLIREAVKNGQRNIPGVKIFEETYTTRR